MSATRTAPLLYWLLVVCGLAGLTVARLRFDAPTDLLPLWLGSIGGIATGLLFARLRVRLWVPFAIGAGAFWLVPASFFILQIFIGSGVDTFFLAFLPAAICAYASMTEHGGLLAFWYPAMLWMLVVLEGATPGKLDVRAAAPFAVGLVLLFVAFLRARETRRAALWRAHAHGRLAATLPRTVLRASPVRAASQAAYHLFAGAAALVVAAWIVPHLWQKEQSKQEPKIAAMSAPAWADSGGELPCCPDPEEERRTRIREYFPLASGKDERERRAEQSSCQACRHGMPIASTSHGVDDGPSAVDLSGAGSVGGGSTTTSSTSTTSSSTGTSTTTDTTSYVSPAPPATGTTTWTPPPPTWTAPPPAAPPPPPVAQSAPPPRSTPQPDRARAAPAGGPAFASAPATMAPAVGSSDTGVPWAPTLFLATFGISAHLFVRAMRRRLTLRHLARPFWHEPIDQRISNHWQRMLIGLRDAGIQPVRDEQPQAFARRVGIEGMTTCATILERVRHGVRVDAADVDAMSAAADAVYDAARSRAGAAGRTVAFLRWPLA